ncbi:MAG: phosphodiester glycosidase family protein [Myxococcaceae bacterium]
MARRLHRLRPWPCTTPESRHAPSPRVSPRHAPPLNPKWKGGYKAVLVFGPDDPKLPAAAILDPDCDDVHARAARYRVAVQGLRMVDCHRKNTWAKSPKQWSAALVAMDGAGRVLFIHCRSPYPMQALIEQLRSLPLGITRAMYLEGGPEASLIVSEGDRTLERVGSYETGFNEDDSNLRFWPIPNVLGVKR